MPVQLTYPGVHVEEVPSGVRAITGVTTSITAFVGRAARGPVGRPVAVTSFGDFERAIGGLWKDSTLGFAVRDFFLNGGSTAVVVRLYRADTGGGAKPSKAALSADTLNLAAAEEGAWGNSLRARVDHDTRPFDVTLGETNTSLFNLYVRDGTTGLIEEHRNLVVAATDHPRHVTQVLENESRLARVTAPGAGRPAASGNTVDGGKTVWDDNAVATNTKVSGGGLASDGQVLTNTQFNGANAETNKVGLFALEYADLFNLLVLPPYKIDGTVDTTVVTAAAVYCEKRRAMLVLDGLPTWDDVGDVTTAFAGGFDTALGTISRNAALFFPRLRQPNPLLDNQVQTFAAAGAVAGVMARTDAQRGVWKAPAGLEAALNGVPELDGAAHRPRDRAAQSARGQLLAGRARRRPGGLGGAHHAGRGPAGQRVEVHPGAAHGAVPRGEPVSRDAVGGLRTQRRAAVGANPAQRGHVHEQPVPAGGVPGRHTARGVLRQVRQGDHDAGRHRPRHRKHPRRLRSAEAGRVRRHPTAADRRPERILTREGKRWLSSASTPSGSTRTRTSSSG